MDTYIALIFIFGAIALLTAWLPMALRELPLSLPIVCIGIGVLIGWSPMAPILQQNPLENLLLTERLTEIVVIIALMGAGLKLDRRIGWKSWSLTWRLLAIAMPLTISGIALVGWQVLGLAPAAAVLLGAALAPTDPVLASDVQVGAPGEGEEDAVRFALTSEAGLNDGLAFPFVYLAIAMASTTGGVAWLQDWLAMDVLWRLSAGLLIGILTGRLLGYLTFRLPEKSSLATSRDGFVALGITFFCYGLTEMAHGYGFVAVFVAAVVLRGSERGHAYHTELHSFTEQIERLLMMVLLVCFGSAISEGSIFDALGWPAILSALLILFVVRPICAWISLGGSTLPGREKAVIAFFGIRGLGSFYYLAFALGVAEFEQSRMLWVTVCLVVLISILMHGAAVTPVMRYVDRHRKRGQEWD